jgi:hypothetical protein
VSTTTPHRPAGRELSPAELKTVADHQRDDGERLLELLSSRPPDQRKRFTPAARQAGCALELLKPGLLAPTSSGLVAGVFSQAALGEVLLVAAEKGRSIYAAIPATAMEAIVAEAERALDGPDVPPGALEARRCGGLVTLAAKLNLETVGRDATRGEMPGLCRALILLGAMLARPEHRDLLRGIVRAGAVPAVVCLLARDRRGSLLLPLVHGAPWPALALSEPEGRA